MILWRPAVLNCHSGSSGVVASMKARGKLALGATGIYVFFILYGIVYEDLINFRTSSGKRFEQVWLMQAVEALVNCIVSGFGIMTMTVSINQQSAFPSRLIAKTGVMQLIAKALTGFATTKGVSTPVVILAKSAKMVPVMIG